MMRGAESTPVTAAVIGQGVREGGSGAAHRGRRQKGAQP
jgi:hypothetical protein